MNYRSSFEFPQPNRKLVAHFLKTAKSPEERSAWRSMLNSEAYHKPKAIVLTKEEKKLKKAQQAAANKAKVKPTNKKR